MPTAPFNISVTAPLTPALERVKRILFQPFALEKWMVIGFAAWLAHLGQGGGSGAGFRFGHVNRADLRSVIEQARQYILDNLSWIIPVAVALGLVFLVVWLVFLWLSCRGQFLFLHCAALDRAEILQPWRQYGRLGDNLFLFRAVLGLISGGLLLPFVVWGIWAVDQMTRTVEGPILWSLAQLVTAITAFVAVAILFGVVRFLTIDFVVPIMALERANCLTAWRRLIQLMARHTLNFLLYLLFSLLITIVIGMAIVVVVVATCCLAGCLLVIPYIGTVLLLPILTFRRCYSLYYLAQYGSEFDIFAQPIQPASQ